MEQFESNSSPISEGYNLPSFPNTEGEESSHRPKDYSPIENIDAQESKIPDPNAEISEFKDVVAKVYSFRMQEIAQINQNTEIMIREGIKAEMNTLIPNSTTGLEIRNHLEEDKVVESDEEENMSYDVKEDIQIEPKDNEKYHEHILNLLKIENNHTLNISFSQIIPQISRNLLLKTDLSANTQEIKNIEEQLLPEHLLKQLPLKDPTFNYYQQYCQLTIANMVMQSQIKKLINEIKTYTAKLKELNFKRKQEEEKKRREEMINKLRVTENHLQQTNQIPQNHNNEINKENFAKPIAIVEELVESLDTNIQDGKPKRKRRIASIIERHYNCPLPNCYKAYGSEGSLNQHLKLKHPNSYYSSHPRSQNPHLSV